MVAAVSAAARLVRPTLTQGRKGQAYDKALFVFVVVFAASFSDGLTQGELDSLLLALAGILASFTTGNVGEHFAGRASAGPPGAVVIPGSPPTGDMS